jgi:hypothetical protein
MLSNFKEKYSFHIQYFRDFNDFMKLLIKYSFLDYPFLIARYFIFIQQQYSQVY